MRLQKYLTRRLYHILFLQSNQTFAELNVIFFFKNHACFGKIYMLVFNIRTSLKAIKDFSYSINYAAEELRNDKGFILEGIKKNGQLFEDISESFRDDREIAVAAIKRRIFNYE